MNIHSDCYAYTALSGSRDYERKDVDCFGRRVLFVSDVMNAKIYKVLPHLFFPDRKSYLWIDANIFLVNKVEYYYEKYLSGHDFAIFQHPCRKNIFEEKDRLRKVDYFGMIPIMEEQVDEYEKQGFDKNILFEANFIMRRNNDIINAFNEKWWSHICRWQYRDQISLPFVINQFSLKINVIHGDIRKHEDFIYKEHYK